MPLVRSPYSSVHTIGNGPVVDAGATAEVSDEDAESLVAQGWLVVPEESPVVTAPKGRRADAPEVQDVASAELVLAESDTQEEN